MAKPVFLTAHWRHLAMVNYAIDPMVLEPHLPAGTQLDFFHGETYVSLVGFLFLDTRLRGWPIPGHRDFEEVNLRFYVRRQCDGELRRGVAFIKEIVSRPAITAVARWVYGENYVTHPMRHKVAESESSLSAAYEWKYRGRWNRLRVHGAGGREFAQPESVEHFITEHYWGYTRCGPSKTLEYEVAHPSWRLWGDCEADVDCEAVAFYGQEFSEALSAPPHSCLLAEGSPVAVHCGTTLAPTSPETLASAAAP